MSITWQHNGKPAVKGGWFSPDIPEIEPYKYAGFDSDTGRKVAELSSLTLGWWVSLSPDGCPNTAQFATPEQAIAYCEQMYARMRR